MKILLIAFLIVCAFYVSNAALSASIGKDVFFAKVILTNQNYGSGAVFPADVWYNLGLKKMRIDYYQTNGTLIMQVYYDYATKDQYQICGTTCARATWTAAQPLFSGVDWSGLSCFASDYTALGGGPSSCVAGCNAYVSQPVQLQGVMNIMFNDSGSSPSQMCLVRFTPSGTTYGPEWQVQTFLSGPTYPSGQDPTVSSVYTPTNTANCPQPSCASKLDIALVIDESTSIVNAGQSNTVLNFCRNLVKGLNIGDDTIRLGVVFFSADLGCDTNQTLTGTVNCGSLSCDDCGAKWRHTTAQTVYTKKAQILSAINSINGGRTCISCGIQQGTIILNQQPRPGIQKTIILFTDGKENVLTKRLAIQAGYAKANGIDIIAIGTYGYTYSDLTEMTTPDKIFTTSDFSQLNSLIGQILTSVCQPLPNIETCDFCSGLCTCKADCSCPTCNNFFKCLNSRCDPKPVSQGGTLGVCVYTPKLDCDDFDACTINGCNNATGCDFSQPTPKPYPRNNLCFDWVCDNTLYKGYKYVEVTNACAPASTDLCVIKYCNYTQGSTSVGGTNLQGSCVSIDTRNIAFGTNQSYVNPQNVTVTVSGCKRDPADPPCVKYTCVANGGCIRDASTCVCFKDSDCYDTGSNAGCTWDTCDTANNRCVRTVRDCWADLSGGSCPSNTGGLPSSTTTTGLQFYNDARTFPTLTNGTNLPNDGASTRSCDLLACYGGSKSTYNCISTGVNNGNSYCQRTATACPSTGCGDTYCRSLNTWSATGTGGFNLNTDCGGTATYTCTNADACNFPACSGGFSGTGCQANGNCATRNGVNRCPLISNATLCNQASVCNIYGCTTAQPTPGCTSTPKPLPVSNYCEIWSCDASRGNVSTNIGGVTVCQQQADLCVINYCDRNQGTTNGQQGSCQSIDRRTFSTTTTRTWTDSKGVTNSITGCTSNAVACFQYGCDAATGQCTIDQSLCNCTSHAQCEDHNGCTDDQCVSNNCVYTKKECWKHLSSGTCDPNVPASNVPDSTVGVTAWQNGVTSAPFDGQPNAAYTCAALACLGGQRSQYQCVSTGDTSFTCQRITSDCSKGGCLDTICTNIGTWANDAAGNPQAVTDCSTTRTPTCSDYACGTRICNTNYQYNVPAGSIQDYTTNGARCVEIDNSTQCQNGDLCKVQGQCDRSSGCVFTQTTNPPTNPAPTCYDQSCDPSSGWILTPKTCTNPAPDPANLCRFTYCNTTQNQCLVVDANNIAFGSSESYIDVNGELKTVLGCGRPANDDLPCKIWGCNSTTGQCYQDTTNCKCISDEGCYDGNGCTIDKCNKAQNQCDQTVVDCMDRLSNGKCNSQTKTPYQSDIFVGINQYYNNATDPANTYMDVDDNNLPKPETGVDRTCQQLGCYNGAPSKYRCFSNAEGSFTCQRTFEQCNRNGCQDNICRTLGTWSTDADGNNQIDADCGTTYNPPCADNNACTLDFCNIDWVPTQPTDQRCLHQLVDAAVYCNDGNFCTQDICEPGDTSGQVCRHNIYPEETLRSTICPKDGQDHNCTTVECTVNRCIYRSLVCPDSTLCILNLCNASTLNTCVAVYTGVFVIDKCGVCDGDGTSCVPNTPVEPRATSIAVALGIGLGIGLCVAAIIIAILTRTGYAAYAALAMEVTGSATINNTHVEGGNYFSTN